MWHKFKGGFETHAAGQHAGGEEAELRAKGFAQERRQEWEREFQLKECSENYTSSFDGSLTNSNQTELDISKVIFGRRQYWVRVVL